jgi:hypothetical protein
VGSDHPTFPLRPPQLLALLPSLLLAQGHTPYSPSKVIHTKTQSELLEIYRNVQAAQMVSNCHQQYNMTLDKKNEGGHQYYIQLSDTQNMHQTDK